MLSLKVALRYLFAPKSHSAVNVISIISVAGVAVATLAIVCVLSVFNGFRNVAASRLSLMDPSLKVTAADGRPFASSDSLTAAITDALGSDVTAVSQVLEEHALAIYGDNQLAVRIKGVDSVYQSAVDFDSIMIDGEFLPSFDAQGNALATIGVGVAIDLGATPGYYDWLQLYMPRRRGRINPANPMASFRGDSVVVSGVFQLNQSEYDNDLVIVPVEIARRLLDFPADVSTSLEVELGPSVNAASAAKQLRGRLGDAYIVADRLQQQSATYRMIEVEKWVTLVLLVFILIIASFNIISTLSMLIIEKRSDISTFRALGAGRGFIGTIFFDQGFLITAFGGMAGIILGVALCKLQEWGGFIKLGGDPSHMSITTYPVSVELTDLFVIFIVAIAIGACVGLTARGITLARMRRKLRPN